MKKLVFDIDGVLIDTRKSYLVAIKQTTEYFVEKEVEMTLIEELKRKEGFNNDWYVAYVLINCLLLDINLDDYSKFTDNKEKFTYEEIKEVFQCIYLGVERYQPKNKKLKRAEWLEGLWKKETLIFSKEELSSLSSKYGKFSIITGRTKEEAEYALDHFNIRDLFSDVISVEDIKDDYFNKFPQFKKYGVDKANPVLFYQIPDIEESNSIFYTGDSVSDMMLVANSRDSLPVKGINFQYDHAVEESKKLNEKTESYKPDYTAKTTKEALTILIHN